MTLLLDQNISYKIVRLLLENFPNCLHVSKAGLTNASDEEIWQYAKKNSCTIVTFDIDFLNLATLKGHPPKIIRLKTGNRKTSQLAQLLEANLSQIMASLTDPTYDDIAFPEISE